MLNEEIPAEELEQFREEVLASPEYLTVKFVEEAYKKRSMEVVTDPFDLTPIIQIQKAMKAKQPFSLVRMGDGEMNILTYPEYSHTPILNRVVAEQSVNKRMHSFLTNHEELNKLAIKMRSALLNADIVGVLGLWRPRKINANDFINNDKVGLRGLSGQWRGVDYMLKLTREGLFQKKLVVSAHCYFAIVKYLDTLLNGLNSLWLITSETESVEIIKNKYPQLKIHVISQPKTPRPLKEQSPYFIAETLSQLPNKLSGELVLIGAGPWAEIYADNIKQRGGVGVDIGTGFDLIAGKMSRPVHRRVKISFDES
jgi:hypothetical protein